MQDRLRGKLESEQECFSPARYLFDQFDQNQLDEMEPYLTADPSKKEKNLSLDSLTLAEPDQALSLDEVSKALSVAYDILFAILYE